MITYCKGSSADKESLLDFINMVFSQSERPHDFIKILPKLYADGIDTMDSHYMVKEDGRIKAVVGVYETELAVGGRVLKLGQVGQVSVHPYARGAGYMKGIMQMAMEASRKKGLDALVLGGLRNRYEYFGFEPAELCLNYHFVRENVRHGCRDICIDGIQLHPVTHKEDAWLDCMFALYNRQTFKIIRSRERFYEILKSWESQVFAILIDGSFMGYLCMNDARTYIMEMLLESPEIFPKVLKLCFTQFGIEKMGCQCAVTDAAMADILAKYCERCTISTGNSWNIFNYENVIQGFMVLKNELTPLADGELFFKISDGGAENDTYRLAVENNRISVEKLPENAVVAACSQLNKLESVTALFTQTGAYARPGKSCAYKNWFPLPLYLNPMDAC